jgi:hypothetical protein
MTRGARLARPTRGVLPTRFVRSLAIVCALSLAGLLGATGASAQRRGPRGGAPAPQPSAHADADESEEQAPAPRTEPEIAPPADPLALTPDARARIGTDYAAGPPSSEGAIEQKQWLPYYEERQGDYRFRMLPPFFLEQSRGLRDPSQTLYGVPKTEDTQGLYSLLYYRRRSLQLDMDVVFPAVWAVRDGDSHTTVVGPVVHREAPGENDNWLAPLFFQGARKDGGYFHSPLLLTTSHFGPSSAFALVGPYFRARSGSDVSMGVAPFLFRGDNGSIDGNRRTYTLIPPLLFYHGEHEVDGTTATVAGPVLVQTSPKADVIDVLPLYYHIHGKPESGGVIEEHTTLFPFFHYGYDPEKSLFILPGYYRRVSHTSDAMLSLFYSHVTGRSGATTLTAAGPVVPLVWDYRDRDLGIHASAVAPFYYTYDSPTGHDWLTPLVGRFESYGEARTWWIFPTFTIASTTHGWENDFHPLIYVGRNEDAAHTVVAPVFWDFANAKGRATVGFPLYWRFAEGQDDAVVQVAANTLYTQKRVAGGVDWQFHLLPLFSYGQSPTGYFWNVLFGLAGYSREAEASQVRALWIPFNSGGAPAHQSAAR